MNQKTGKITAIAQRKDDYGILLEGDPIWLNGKGVCSGSKGDIVLVDYDIDDRGYRKIVNMTKTGLTEEKKPPEKPSQDKPTPDNSGFTPASELALEDRIVAANALVWGKCYEAIKGILGRKPTTDGEFASVNSTYIACQKNISSQMIMKLADKIRNGIKT